MRLIAFLVALVASAPLILADVASLRAIDVVKSEGVLEHEESLSTEEFLRNLKIEHGSYSETATDKAMQRFLKSRKSRSGSGRKSDVFSNKASLDERAGERHLKNEDEVQADSGDEDDEGDEGDEGESGSGDENASQGGQIKRSGKKQKKQLPENCKIRRQKQEIPCPPVPPLPPRRKCSGVSASWSGDPHFTTFDQVRYDCQGEGEFDVVKSFDEKFFLQGRFVKFDDNRRPTVTKAIVFETGDEQPKVQINVPDKDAKTCEPFVFVDGEKKSFGDEETTVEGIHIKKTKTTKEDGYIFFYEGSEIQLSVAAKKSSANGCVLRAELCIPDCYHRMTAMGGEGFVGLLGTPDGNPENDWTGKDGEVIKVEAKKQEAEYAYCTENWCIDDPAKSLFTYEDGESFDDLNQCGQGPDEDTPKCVADPTTVKDFGDTFGEDLLMTCAAEDVPCLVDGCVGGVSAAEQYVEASLNQVDKNCATLISVENSTLIEFFEGDDAVGLPFEIPGHFTQVSVEFQFRSEGSTADMSAYVGDTKLDLGASASDDTNGAMKSIYWSRTKVAESIGDGGDAVRVFRYLLKIPPSYFDSGTLSFAFEPNIADGKYASIENLEVLAFKSACTIECTGTSMVVENFDDDDDSDWGAVGSLPGGHAFLGPLTGSVSAIKTFDVTTFADSAQIDFTLYTFGDWTGGGTLLVSVGDLTFDVGQFIDESPDFWTVGSAGDATEDEGADEEAADEGADIYDSTIKWQRTPFIIGADIMGNGPVDSSHKVMILVPSDYVDEGQLTVGFKAEGGVKAGIDNFEIMVFPDPEKCEGEKKVEEENKSGKCKKKEEEEEEEEEKDERKCFKNVRVEECSPTPAPATDDETTAPTVPTTSAPTTPAPTQPKNLPTTLPPKPSPVDAPTPAPSATKPPVPTWITGDPHIRKWNGDTYDFHGECELVMLQNPDFNNGQGLHIHIRTKLQRWWSFIDSAVVKIGDDTLEVKSGVQDRKYWVNGVERHRFKASRNLDFTLGGFGGRFRAKNDHVVQYKIYLPDDQVLMIRSVKDMLRVEIEGPHDKHFHSSVGLMGSFGDGAMLRRDGTTEFEDTNAFGQEWQVRPSDPQLFHSAEGPQYPEQCKMPDATASAGRRLSATVSRPVAEKACAHVDPSDFKNCVFDVIATDDVDAAEGY